MREIILYRGNHIALWQKLCYRSTETLRSTGRDEGLSLEKIIYMKSTNYTYMSKIENMLGGPRKHAGGTKFQKNKNLEEGGKGKEERGREEVEREKGRMEKEREENGK